MKLVFHDNNRYFPEGFDKQRRIPAPPLPLNLAIAAALVSHFSHVSFRSQLFDIQPQLLRRPRTIVHFSVRLIEERGYVLVGLHWRIKIVLLLTAFPLSLRIISILAHRHGFRFVLPPQKTQRINKLVKFTSVFANQDCTYAARTWDVFGFLRPSRFPTKCHQPVAERLDNSSSFHHFGRRQKMDFTIALRVYKRHILVARYRHVRLNDLIITITHRARIDAYFQDVDVVLCVIFLPFFLFMKMISITRASSRRRFVRRVERRTIRNGCVRETCLDPYRPHTSSHSRLR